MSNLKLIWTLILVLILGLQYSSAQVTDIDKIERTSVFKHADSTVVEGYLYQLKDSTIIVASTPPELFQEGILYTVDVMDIQKIEFKQNGQGGKRFLIGALTGVGVGSLIGLASGGSSDGFISFTRGESVIMIGTLFGIGGGLIYGFGGGKQTVKINGSLGEYYINHKKLKKHLFF